MPPSTTNQTGLEMVRPDFRPMTLILISCERAMRAFRESFGFGMGGFFLRGRFSLVLDYFCAAKSTPPPSRKTRAKGGAPYLVFPHSDLREAMSMEKRYFTSDLSSLS